MKSEIMSWPWDLGPRNYIWATWAQETYPAIRQEPWLQFSQTGPHFLQNHGMNPIKLWNLKKCLDLRAWRLEPRNHIWATWDQKTYKAVRLMYSMINAPCRNDKDKCFYQISSLALAQFLAFLKTINFDTAMLILHCWWL